MKNKSEHKTAGNNFLRNIEIMLEFIIVFSPLLVQRGILPVDFTDPSTSAALAVIITFVTWMLMVRKTQRLTKLRFLSAISFAAAVIIFLIPAILVTLMPGNEAAVHNALRSIYEPITSAFAAISGVTLGAHELIENHSKKKLAQRDSADNTVAESFDLSELELPQVREDQIVDAPQRLALSTAAEPFDLSELEVPKVVRK